MKTFIFDLDGTLLPMESQEQFIEAYFKALSLKMSTYGLNPQDFIKAVWTGTMAMIDNDGSKTNKDRFWEVFSKIMGEEVSNMEEEFEDFYRNEFIAAKATTSVNPLAKECIDRIKEKGYRLILATNPLFPQVATHARVRWAGLEPEDFEYITTYENSSYCKPNLKYYEEILKVCKLEAKDCIMVGNDVKEDMCAEEVGMQTYLLTDCLIKSMDDDINRYRKGSFKEFYEFVLACDKV